MKRSQLMVVSSVLVFIGFFCLSIATEALTNDDMLIKLDDQGNKLAKDAIEWTMVLDNETGLIWEVKTTDGSIHDKQAGYDWSQANEVFIVELNKMKFGGYSDWRMPTTNELRTIRVKGAEPYIDQDFFPNTIPTSYMSWKKCGSGEIFDERVKFGKIRNQKTNRQVRAVRGGQVVQVGDTK